MTLQIIIQLEVSQKARDTYPMISRIGLMEKLILMNLFPQRRALTYSEHKLVVNQAERCDECITEDIGF